MPLIAVAAYWALSHLLMLMSIVLIVSLRTWASRNQAASLPLDRKVAAVAPILGPVVIGLAIAHCAFYLWLPNFTDYGEPTIPLLAGNIAHGSPVYGDWRLGHDIVGSNYGPYIFLLQLPALLYIPTISASKFVGVFFGLSGPLLLFLAARRRTGSAIVAITVVALMIAMMSTQIHSWFWNRPDPILISMVCASVLLFETASPTICLCVFGLLAGIATDLKLFGSIYLLPIAIASAVQIKPPTKLLWSITIAAVLFVISVAAPFQLQSFSAHAYVANLSMMPNQGLQLFEIWQSLVYAMVILALPFLAWRGAAAPLELRLMGIALVACAAVVAVISGKPGGGTFYMTPLVPLALYLAIRLSNHDASQRPGAAAQTRNLVLCAVTIWAAPCWAFSWYKMAEQLPVQAVERARAIELRSLFLGYPGSEMGHNSGPATDEYFRVEKAFLGQTTRFDYVNFIDQRAAGLSGSVLYPLFDHCSVPSWILSRQGARFLGRGWGDKPLLDANAIARFHANYDLAVQDRFYEVWRCRKGPTPVARAGAVSGAVETVSRRGAGRP